MSVRHEARNRIWPELFSVNTEKRVRHEARRRTEICEDASNGRV
jgi:hypothetical protein